MATFGEPAKNTTFGASKGNTTFGAPRRRDQDLFQGGGFSDVLDAIQIPQFAATGALTPGLSIKQAVQQKVAPSKALGLTGTPGKAALGFAADVVLDPLNFLGIGASTKLGKAFKLGKFTSVEDATGLLTALKGAGKLDDAARLAKAIDSGADLAKLNKIAQGANLFDKLKSAGTLAGAAKTGERSLLSLDVPFAKSLQGIPLTPKSVDESFFGALTRIGQPIKRVLPDIRAGKAAPAGSTLEQIEEFTSANKQFDQFIQNLSAEERALVGGKQDELSEMARQFDRLKKSKIITEADEANIYKKLAAPERYASIKLSDEAQGFYQKLSVQSDELQNLWVANKGAILEGSGLPNVLKKEAKAFQEAASKKYAAGSRILGGKTESDLMASITRFVDDTGKAKIGTVEKLGLKSVDNIQDVIKQIESPVTKSLARIIKRKETLASDITELLTVHADELSASNKLPSNVKQMLASAPKGTKITIPKSAVTPAVQGKIAKIEKEIAGLDNLIKKKNTDASDVLASIMRQTEALGPEANIYIPKGKVTADTQLVKRTKATANEIRDDLGLDIFREEPFIPLFAKAQSTFKKQTTNKFIEGAKSQFGKPIAKGMDPDPGFAKSTLKELEGFQFPEQLVDQMDSTFEKFSNIDEVNNFLKQFDKIQNFWKGTATFVNPAFHTRNFISNLWQMYLGDGLDAKSFGKAFKMIRKRGDLTKMNKADRKIWDEFVEYGLGGTGWTGGDIDKQIRGFSQNPVFRAGGAVGSYVEDQAKLAMYISRLNEGYKPAEAAVDVRKYLFDYGDLSNLERNTFKRIFPFYTWTRNNLPLQAAMLIQKPGKFSPIAKAKRAIESMQEDKPMDQKYLPPWLQEGYTVFLGKDGKGMQRFFNLEGFLPGVDVGKLASPDRLKELPGELLTPLIKTPWELMTNYDLFYEKQIKEFDGQRTEFFQQQLPVELVKVLRSFRPATEIERLVAPRENDAETPFLERLGRFGLGKIEKLNAKDAKGISQFYSDKDKREVEKDFKKAKERKDKSEMERLKEIINNFK